MKILCKQELNKVSGGTYKPVGVNMIANTMILELPAGSEFQVDDLIFNADARGMEQGGIYGRYQVVFEINNNRTTFILTLMEPSLLFTNLN